MISLASQLISPLAGPECRRALGRGWLLLVRSLAALAMLGTMLIVLWFWRISQDADPNFLPFNVVRFGVATIEGMLVTIALVMAPALLAGSIAGEKERGVMGLLLTTRVSPREIVLGRLVGKLTQVAMVLLAGLPALVALAALSGMSMPTLAVLLGLPVAVAVGGGGLSVLASTLSRRGRDALLTVYLIDVLFLVSPLAGLVRWSTAAGLGALNPFVCLQEVAWREGLTPALVSIVLWLVIGLAATALAAWQLRPACLRPLDGERVMSRRKRRGRVPPLDEKRPMLWKELYIERVGMVSGLGWWLGALLVVLLGGGSLVLVGLLIGGEWIGVDPLQSQWLLSQTIGDTRTIVGCLLQWAVGLRAAVAISSERERGTWDALLTSPLEGREIVRSKLWGSLHALRWLFVATFQAWTIAALCGAMSWSEYATAVIGTAITATYMAAVGVRTSLASSTATRAMAITIGIWLGTSVAVAVISGIVFGAVLLGVTATIQLATMGTYSPPMWLMRSVPFFWSATNYAVYIAATLLLVADTRLRFDRIAGRMTAGKVEVGIDRLIHGKPRAPRSLQPAEPDEVAGEPVGSGGSTIGS